MDDIDLIRDGEGHGYGPGGQDKLFSEAAAIEQEDSRRGSPKNKDRRDLVRQHTETSEQQVDESADDVRQPEMKPIGYAFRVRKDQALVRKQEAHVTQIQPAKGLQQRHGNQQDEARRLQATPKSAALVLAEA